jgi:hypothetical protein
MMKSEATTNACVYELLRCVTELSRRSDDPPFRLEWSITQDTFAVQAGEHHYSTTNDGNLLYRALCRLIIGGSESWCFSPASHTKN